MDPPADGDELARVVPLRRRDRELTAAPGARGSLPRERAPFDPEIEPGDIPSRRRLPRTVARHVTRSPLRSRRVPRRLDETRAAASRRHSLVVLLTGAAGAGLAAVAVLALLVSILNQSSPVPPPGVGSLGRSAPAGALAPNKTEMLSASSNPLGVTGTAATRKAAATVAIRPHRARLKSTRPRPTHNRGGGRTLSINHQSALVASYTPGTSAATSRAATPDTQSPATTNSTPTPVSASTPEGSTSPSRTSSSSGSTRNRPVFGEQGVLGPGSSPDS
jgi:hypothetical protein